jgi:hypothetical protein
MLSLLRRLSAAGVFASATVLALVLSLCLSWAQPPSRRALPSSRPSFAKKTPQAHAAPVKITALTVQPAAVQLNGPRAEAHFVVLAALSDGATQEITDRATRKVAASTVAQFRDDGALHPVKDGITAVQFAYAGRTATARVTVKDAAKLVPISFNNEIVPILTRIGCNQGSCHGAQYGKGGFKLSLAGFDADLDFTNTVKQAKGRRVSTADPEHSLLLLKPTMAVPHGGGRRLEPGSQDCKTLTQWLRDGAPAPDPADPQVTKIEVFPSERILPKEGDRQRLVVRATYTDGTTRDVTRWARLNTLNDAIASCTPEGVVTAIGRGQTAIMVRYSGQATVANMLVPFALRPSLAQSGKTGKGGASAGVIDALVSRKQRQLGLTPSPLCDDATFARRVSIDLIGTSPTPQEITAFTADRSPDRRARLVDALLARPEYADYWSLKWGDLLRNNRAALGPKGMWSFSSWIHTQLQQNRPVDAFVRDLILAQGSTYTNGPSNYYRVASNPQDLAETTSQVFLGVRLQCARCHHHPFEKWSQTDYYQFAAFFARVGIKGSNDFGIFGNEQVVRINGGGEVGHPKTGKRMYPTPLGVQLASLPEDKRPDPDAGGDRRRALAEWLTGKDNRLFARNLANRYWGYLFGKGIVNPIDDMRVTNPPTNPELLDALAGELIRSNYDLKHLLRVICTSQTYQRSSEATPQNGRDDVFFTHYLPKHLPAESLLDAIDFACGTHEKFPELPPGTRAIQLPDPSVGSDFLDTFGRPQRLIACECERVSEPNLSQTLRMMNGELVNRKVSDGNGRIAKLIAAKKPDETILKELYMVTLGRLPRQMERNMTLGVLAFSPDRRHVFEDVLITLLNSKEFQFNH